MTPCTFRLREPYHGSSSRRLLSRELSWGFGAPLRTTWRGLRRDAPTRRLFKASNRMRPRRLPSSRSLALHPGSQHAKIVFIRSRALAPNRCHRPRPSPPPVEGGRAASEQLSTRPTEREPERFESKGTSQPTSTDRLLLRAPCGSSDARAATKALQPTSEHIDRSAEAA